MVLNLFLNKKEGTYATSKVTQDILNKQDYDFICELPQGFENSEAPYIDMPIAKYTSSEISEKLESLIASTENDLKLLNNAKKKLS